jgi:PAS domain S-box-containing protein
VNSTPLALLFVEDHEGLRQIGVEMLRELGHEVLAAPDAERALEMLAQRSWDAVMTDVSLPGISGVALAKQVIRRWPRVSIILSSGHADVTRELIRRELRNDVLVLPKPFDLDALEQILEEVVRLRVGPSTAPIQLDRSEERFRLLVEGVTDYAIFMLDPQGHVLTWNTGAKRIKGYEANEIIGQHFSKFYPPDAVHRHLPEHELEVAGTEGRFEDEGWRVRKDGTRFWANVVITALRSDTGLLHGFAKVTRDLTQRREHEEALRQSEERFRLLVDGVSEYAIFMLDPNGYVMTWNSGAERIKGYRADEIVGQHFSKFYPLDAVESGWPEHELQVATETGRFVEDGWRIRKDGKRFWANVTITALRDRGGQLHGFAKLTRDLSERRRAEALEVNEAQGKEMLEAERSARIAAQRAARMKDEFLATLSHELRTPLNSILGWTQILRRQGTPKPEDFHRAMEVIERNTRAQAKLIEDLLDLSRVMSGRIRLDVQQTAIVEVVRGAIESAEPIAQTKGVRLESVLDPRGGTVSGDPGRLQQIVWNLLTNAIKFTPKGGKVQVLLQRINSHIEISVSDTGIGISASFLPYVFDRFSQNDSSTTRSQGGLGLGLAISKQLVELHGGSLQAKSPGEGQGATFIVTIPLTILETEAASANRVHPTHPVPEEQSILPDLEGVHALVVDDEADARDLIRRVLQEQGATVSVVACGAEAIRIMETSSPDILISDVGMPDMDGYQLMRHIRASERLGRRIPAVALTAFARAEDRKRALLAGYQSHVAKPVDTAELLIVIAGLVRQT